MLLQSKQVEELTNVAIKELASEHSACVECVVKIALEEVSDNQLELITGLRRYIIVVEKEDGSLVSVKVEAESLDRMSVENRRVIIDRIKRALGAHLIG